MRASRFALEFRVELNRDEMRMIGQLQDFHQGAIGAEPREPHPVRFVLLAIQIVEFVAMAMSFGDDIRLISSVGYRVLCKLSGLSAEPHRTSHQGNLALFIE